jgi:hypothetical protein
MKITTWVREHGKVVDPKLWKVDEPPPSADAEEHGDAPAAGPGGGPPMNPGMIRRMTRLYDCKPERGLVAPDAVDRSRAGSH